MGMLEMANGMAKNVQEESKLLQEMVTVEKRKEKKSQKAKGTTSTGAKTKEKSSNSKRSKIIVEIYGHELYRGIDAGLNGSM
jgi:hypothetical protein